MPLSKHVEEIITREGSAKASTETRRSRLTSSRPLNERAQINEDVKKICRLAVRHPSDEVVNQLHVIHGKMKEQFLNMSDEGITWMLGGSSEMSRGGFHDDPQKSLTAAQKFKAFLRADPTTIPIQKMITSIETIGTAMGYRAINATWVAPHGLFMNIFKSILCRIIEFDFTRLLECQKLLICYPR